MNTSRSAPPTAASADTSARPSGPEDVPVSLVVAARNGDPSAFARMVEHWHPNLLTFVHHTLGGLGDTDRVLAAAYVRAYRALPRYQAHRTPGLWLHRIAFLAATDELRRLRRNPARRGGRSEPPAGSGDAPPAWYRLGPDQRALAVMLDLEEFAPASVASAFDTDLSVVNDRVARARSVLAEPSTAAAPPAYPAGGQDPSPNAEPDPAGDGHVQLESFDDLAREPATPEVDLDAEVAMWKAALIEVDEADPAPAVDPITHIDLTEPTWPDPDPAPTPIETPAPTEIPAAETAAPTEPATPTEDDLRAASRARLRTLAVPATPEGFWSDLGRRLLAERASPAAPTLDPIARLAKAHPSEPGFNPEAPRRGRDPKTVTGLAEQADWVRPRRRWGLVLGVVAGLVLVGAVVWFAIRLGTSDPVPDGSVTAAVLAEGVAAALAEGPHQSVEMTIEAPAGVTATEPVPHRAMISANGSWVLSATDRYDHTTYDAAEGILRRVALVGATADGAEGELLATEERGFATGLPDVAAPLPGPLEDLRLVLGLLENDPEHRVPATTVRDTPTWTYVTTAATGPNGSEEGWRLVVRRSDELPMVVERTAGETVVRRTDFSAFQLSSDVTSTTFMQPMPDGVEPTVTDHGFVTTELAAVGLLGRGEAVTPAWLPEGFELTGVAVRHLAPLSTRPTGDGQNPPDESVASITFRRGVQSITVSTREAGDEPARWRDPFPEATARGPATEETVGDGRFNGADVSIRTTAVGGAQLWGVHDGMVFTVSGDLTTDEALRVAATLR